MHTGLSATTVRYVVTAGMVGLLAVVLSVVLASSSDLSSPSRKRSLSSSEHIGKGAEGWAGHLEREVQREKEVFMYVCVRVCLCVLCVACLLCVHK